MDLDDIETVAVLGAGNMGHGIAEVAALAGYDVWLRDVDDDRVNAGLAEVEWSLDKLVEHGRIDRETADAARERITGVVDLEAAASDADVVVEAVPEEMDLKRSVYAAVESVAPDRTVFATNTSSLSITDLAAATDRPERFCGMHFFNPPVRMDLVEVIPGEATDEDVVNLIAGLAESMDKTPVRVQRDRPGFIVNRVLAPLMNEAAWLVDDGEASLQAVDATATYDLGLPMGPFELADHVGIDVCVDVLAYLHAELGDAYEPCPRLVEQVEAGDLGQKTGAGFYDYDDAGPSIPADAGREDLADLFVAVMGNEVAKLIDEGVADAATIDRALKLAAGFPDGPAAMADEAGLAAVRDTLAERHEATGAARYEPAAALRERAATDRPFRDRAVPGENGSVGDGAEEYAFETLAVTVADRVAHVELDRPHRMNTVTIQMLDDLVEAVEALEADESVRALLLTGAGDRAFSAGADVQSMAGDAQPLDAVQLSRRGQEAFCRLESASLPVVAGVDGYCLGGGMELATCADLRVASEAAEFGQPEHDLGILPGWGGTQRLREVVGEGRATEIIFTADRYDAATMAEYGFVNEVVEAGALRAEAMALAADLADGPPIAQRLTKRAMLAGRDDTDAGLEAEALAFGHLFGTADAMEGFSAFVADRDPEFEGQ